MNRDLPVSLTPEYMAYQQAKYRCTNPNHIKWDDYGGRGIEFHFTSFKEFFDELGPRPTAKHSLDRTDNDGHYERGNVRWATKSEQSWNRRSRSQEIYRLVDEGWPVRAIVKRLRIHRNTVYEAQRRRKYRG